MEKQEKKDYVGIMENQEFQGEMVNPVLLGNQVCLKITADGLFVRNLNLVNDGILHFSVVHRTKR